MYQYRVRIGMWCYLSLALFLGPFAALSQAPSQGYTISTTSRLVLLDVAVRKPNGTFVSGLSKDSFHVFEDGKPQTITQFANSDVPVTVGLAVDESGSMRAKR